MEKGDFVEIFHIAFPSRSSSPLVHYSLLFIKKDHRQCKMIGICWWFLTSLFRPEDRVNRLAEQLANSEGKIGEIV